MRKSAIIVIMMLMWMGGAVAQTTMTPSKILERVVTMITATKGVEAGFTVNNSGYTGRGMIKTSGNKYQVIMPDVEVWFNGKDLYTYNKSTKETTVVTPTAEEIAESNPLGYVVSAQKNYNVAFSTVKKANKYVLELLPKTKGGDIKRITLTVDKTDYKPEKIVVEPKGGSPISADITGFKTGVSSPAADFEYPKAKYPKAEIVDLR